MHGVVIPFLFFLFRFCSAQTYSGCHDHGTIEYCYGADGKETAVHTHTNESPSVTPATSTPAAVSASITAAAQTTAVTGCHLHESTIVCIAGNSEEVTISASGSPTGELPAQYTGCHQHDEQTLCLDPQGDEVLVLGSGTAEGSGHSEDNHTESESGELDCHFHAGVEHCVGAGESEGSLERTCDVPERTYNIPLRIGTLFVIMVTSGIGVFLPILVKRVVSKRVNDISFAVIKQFGTGVVISAALIHLLTHAQLMFANECIGEIAYEPTATAITMAGLFLSFLVEYIGQRLVMRRSKSTSPTSEAGETGAHDSAEQYKSLASGTGYTLTNLGHSHGADLVNSRFSVLVMEAGIIFHSILIGLTLVVASDSIYITLFVVIIFHQGFEGLALGARIAQLPNPPTSFFPTKFLMAAAFTLITPLGMAIGIGVLDQFNGNNPSTVIAIGTLDALSAGILLWVGVVDMWARDWMWEGGDMAQSGFVKTVVGGGALVAGMALMSLLGRWT